MSKEKIFEILTKTNILKLVTGLSIVIMFMFNGFALIYLEVPERNEPLYHTYMGIVDAAFIGSLVNYFFGSSKKEHDLTNDNRPEPIAKIR